MTTDDFNKRRADEILFGQCLNNATVILAAMLQKGCFGEGTEKGRAYSDYKQIVNNLWKTSRELRDELLEGKG